MTAGPAPASTELMSRVPARTGPRPVPRSLKAPIRIPKLLLLAILAAGFCREAESCAWGQSWLSEPPAGASGGGLLAGMTVPQLLAAQAQADPRELYAILRARVESEGAGPPKPEAQRPASERQALATLLQLADTLATPAEQERLARAFVDRYPDDDQFPVAFVRLNQALLRQDKPLESSFFFDQAAVASLPPAWASRYLLLQAAAAERHGDFAAGADFRLQEYESPRGIHQSQPQDIVDSLERITDQAALVRLLSAWSRIGWVSEQAPFLRVRTQIHAGQTGAALLALEEMEHGPSALSEAQIKLLLDVRNEAHHWANVRPERIGVLLPLGSSSPQLRELALDTLDGLRLALGSGSLREASRSPLPGVDFEVDTVREGRNPPSAAPLPPYELVVKDTGNNPQTAAQAVEALARSEGVIAIIGPLARAESEASAARAEELGVPLISLSLSLDLPAGGQYEFRHSKSQEEEVRDLVWYAMDYFQARRFAILYPSNGYGERMLQLFDEEVRRKGGQVTAASAFTPWNVKAQQGEKEPVGLKQIFQSFVGQDRPLRQGDRDLLEAVGDSLPDPIVDFDALFIPVGQDAGQDLRLIAPYPVTVDAENVLLLGTRFWNDDAVLVAGGGKLEGSLFADVYDRAGASPRVAAFYIRHHAWFGHRLRYAAPSYYTAIGYDTLNLLMNELRDPRHRTRESLARSLKSSQPYPGVTGLTSFRPSGEAEKETMFFRIRNGEFVRQLH